MEILLHFDKSYPNNTKYSNQDGQYYSSYFHFSLNYRFKNKTQTTKRCRILWAIQPYNFYYFPDLDFYEIPKNSIFLNI